MPGIFISYRRDDAPGHAGRLFDRLREHFASDPVFMDVARIGAGQDFVRGLEGALAECDLLLAVIGPKWLSCADSTGRRRLDDPTDFLCMELATAFRRQVTVLPVLVGGASVPPAESLPTALKGLSRQVVHLRESSWDSDIASFISVIEERLAPLKLARVLEEQRQDKTLGIGWFYAGLAAFSALSIFAAYLLMPTMTSFLSTSSASIPAFEHSPVLKPELTIQNMDQRVKVLQFLADGRIVAASSDGLAFLNLALRKTEFPMDVGEALLSFTPVHNGGLALGTRSGVILLWNSRTGKVYGRLEGHTGAISALKELPDGTLASASWDNSVRLWNLSSLKLLTTLSGHTNQARALVALPLQRIASTSLDGTIRVWNLSGEKLKVTVLTGRDKALDALIQLPDGRIASGSEDGVIEIWNLATGKSEASLKGPTNWVSALLALKDGRIASAYENGRIQIWNPGTGVCDANLIGHSQRVNSLIALTDGRIASSSDDRSIKIWNPLGVP